MYCLTASDFGDFSRLGKVVVLWKGRRSPKKREKSRKSVTVNVHFADGAGANLRRHAENASAARRTARLFNTLTDQGVLSGKGRVLLGRGSDNGLVKVLHYPEPAVPSGESLSTVVHIRRQSVVSLDVSWSMFVT